MNGNPNEWVVTFHGINYPAGKVTDPKLLHNKDGSQSFNVF